MNGSEKLKIIMLMHHLESLRMMSKCTPMPFSKATPEFDNSGEYFYYDENNPRMTHMTSGDESIQYPVLFFGCTLDNDNQNRVLSEMYMESTNELAGLHIDVVFTKHDSHDGWFLLVYDDDYQNGMTGDSAMFMDGELML